MSNITPVSASAMLPTQPEAGDIVSQPILEGQDIDSDSDSAFASDGSSTADSVASSVRKYRTMHGRTYHNYKDAEYWGPNDEAAKDQLDIGHHMFTLVLDDKLFLAPLDTNVQRVLDLGTGTGIWAIDFADRFPSASVIGTDISPIQPGWVPPNLKFEIDDAQLEWTYSPDTFDFVYIRCLSGSISDWPLLYSRALTAIKPGGYFEHFETDVQIASDDGSLKEGDTMLEWSKLFLSIGEKMGRSFTLNTKKMLEEAGFEDVVEEKFKIPMGPWMVGKKWREIGRWNLLFSMEGLEGYALYMLTQVMGWSYDEVQLYLVPMRKAMKDPERHSYYTMTATYGRKPAAA